VFQTEFLCSSFQRPFEERQRLADLSGSLVRHGKAVRAETRDEEFLIFRS